MVRIGEFAWSSMEPREGEFDLDGIARAIPMGEGRQNPALLIEHKRFVTEEWRRFVRNQAEVIRSLVDPRQFITTNLGGLGWANRFGRHLLSQDLEHLVLGPRSGMKDERNALHRQRQPGPLAGPLGGRVEPMHDVLSESALARRVDIPVKGVAVLVADAAGER